MRLCALEGSGVVSHVGTSAKAPGGLDGVGGTIATESSAASTQEGAGERRHDAVQRVDWTDETTSSSAANRAFLES